MPFPAPAALGTHASVRRLVDQPLPKTLAEVDHWRTLIAARIAKLAQRRADFGAREFGAAAAPSVELTRLRTLADALDRARAELAQLAPLSLPAPLDAERAAADTAHAVAEFAGGA